MAPFARELLEGDPIELYVRFTNIDEKPVRLRFYDQLSEADNLLVEVKGPADREFRSLSGTGATPSVWQCGEFTPDPVKPGGSRAAHHVLCVSADPEVRGIGGEPGDWQIRAKVLLTGKEFRESAPVTIKVSKRPEASARLLRKNPGLAYAWPAKTATAFGPEFADVQKQNDQLGGYLAEQNRRRFLQFRLNVAGTEQSKEGVVDVLQAVEDYLKTADDPVRDDFCRQVADVMLWRQERGDQEALAIGRKYLDRVACLPDQYASIPFKYSEQEARIKAKAPGKK